MPQPRFEPLSGDFLGIYGRSQELLGSPDYDPQFTMSYCNSQEDRKSDSLWLTLFTTPTSSFATWRLYKPFDFPAVISGLGRAHHRPFVFF